MKLFKVEYKYIDKTNSIQELANVHVACDKIEDCEALGKTALKKAIPDLRMDCLHLLTVTLLETNLLMEGEKKSPIVFKES